MGERRAGRKGEGKQGDQSRERGGEEERGEGRQSDQNGIESGRCKSAMKSRTREDY